MYKQILKTVTLLFLLTTPVLAASLQPPSNPENENLDNAVNIKEVVDQFPPLQNGVAFSMVENNLNYLGTFRIAEKFGLSLNAGYAGAQETTGHKLVATVEYDLFNAEKHGWTMPILKYLNVSAGIWGGAGNFDNPWRLNRAETDWGFCGRILEARFW